MMADDNTVEAFPGAEEFIATKPSVTSSWFEECVVEAEEWLIERLLPRKAYAGMFGRRGGAKTFLALHMAACGATGTPFLGEETETFGTVYCVGEKKARFGKRIVAWRERFNKGKALPVGLLLRWGVPDLLDAGAVEDFIAEVNGLRPEFNRRGAPLGLVIFDTLARCLKHANVSDADAAGTAIENIQRIVEGCGVTVVPLAHVAKAEGSSTAKGAGEWEDAADSLIRIDRKDGEKLRTVTVAKQSDEADGGAYGFELEIVDVGISPRGRTVTSCVIRQVDLPPDAGQNGRFAKLGAQAELVMRAFAGLEEAGHSGVVPPVPGVKPGTRGFHMDDLRAAAYEAGLQSATKPHADAPKAEQNKWMEARKKAFQRAVDKLDEARKLRQERSIVWRL